MEQFVKAEGMLIPVSQVRSLDVSRAAEDVVVIYTLSGERCVALGFDAVEAVMLCKPSVYEGLRMSWRRYDWALHNLLAHPLMQIMAWVGFGRAAVRLHDWSTPRPRHAPGERAVRMPAPPKPQP